MNQMNIQNIKQRFGIIGNSSSLSRAIEIAVQVAPTDLSVLITGESGTGKEIMPQIIHHLSSRKHGSYIAVNCGAIPEGTIDSELFGHEKGSFTGAHESRKGYFEVADAGTIFLDEVAELPLPTQARLLRVLETGEYIRVGSSKVMKTNVRIIAASNVNIPEAVRKGKFREDLYYRLNTVPVAIPPLRERKEDIALLFRKFASDFAEKYRMPAIKLTDDALQLFISYSWPGNVRQLKNITEQISVIETEREINARQLENYLPKEIANLPVYAGKEMSENFSEREILYKVLFEMRTEMNDLKSLVSGLLRSGNGEPGISGEQSAIMKRLFSKEGEPVLTSGEHVSGNYAQPINISQAGHQPVYDDAIEAHEEVEETLSLEEREKDLIKKALNKHRNKRKYAAKELGISERTLYRKIKEYKLK